MERQVFEYDRPDRFVAGTVGEPGQRTFYLQASGSGRVTSVALEKQQVAVLAERMDELLDEVLRRSGGTAVPALAPTDTEDRAPLDSPVTEEFRVGTMAIAWDDDAGMLLLEARALTDDEETGDGTDESDVAGADVAEQDEDDSNDDDNDVLRVRLTPAQARAFAKRASQVVAAGRRPCPFCGLPLDPAGHVCPRQNGYLRR
jgi:uncharacterized repeat protein (TIGR03847 family)